jgi:hypothetical protein
MVGDLWQEGFSPCSPLFAPKEGQKVPEEMEEPSVGGKVGGHKDTVTAVISVSIKRHLTSALTFFFLVPSPVCPQVWHQCSSPNWR